MSSESHAKRVAANIRAEMARSKRTQENLALSIGMTQQALSRRLSGRTKFSVDDLANIAAALDVRLSDLVGEAVA